MQKLILTIALIAALIAPIQPAAAAPSVMPTSTVETINRPGPSRPGEPSHEIRRCTIKLKAKKCSLKINGVNVTVYINTSDLMPVTFNFGPEYGVVSMVYNGSHTSATDGYTASNTLNSDGSVTAKVVW